MLDFGLLYEVCVEEPITRERELEVFQGLLDQVKTADEVGFRNVWHVEHHFMREFAHSSSNDVILGAYASVTKNIRLGYGVKLLPFGFNHPVKAAEAGATLDLMSNGRVDYGTGRGLTWFEFEGFGVDPNNARPEWRESIEMIVKAWEDEPFEWDSPSFKIGPQHVVPKPVQQPHPPLWLACASPDSHTIAGEMGLGLLSLVLMTPVEELARRVALYRDGLACCEEPIGKFVNDQAGAFTLVYCGESDEEARATAADAFVWYVKKGLEYVATLATYVEGKDVPAYQYLEELMGIDVNAITFDYLHDNDMVIVGSPETCIEKIRRYEETGINQLLCYTQGRGMPMDKVRSAIERFGKEVIPAFAGDLEHAA